MKVAVLGLLTMIGVVGSAGDSLAAVNPDSVSTTGAVTGERGFEGAVVEIEVGQKGLMDLRKFEEWVAILQRAETEKARAVVFRIDAPGGYVEETERLAEQVAELPVPCYALIEGKALGAGVLLALATQSIYVTPEDLIGGAGLLAGAKDEEEAGKRQRTSLMLARIRKLAGKKGHDLEVIQAMLEPSEEQRRFGDLVVPRGTILTLTAQEAVAQVEGEALLAE